MKPSSVFQSVKALLAPSDEHLMWRVQTYDDAAAFGELVARWQAPIQRLAARMTGDAHRAEDLAQDVFTRLFQHRMAFRLECKVSTYLWRIALNRCYSETRFVAARREIPFEPPVDGEGIVQHEPVATECSPDEQVVASETAEAVRQALTSLPPPYRSIVILRHYEGLKFREIAEVLDLPEGTVKCRMTEALNRLARSLHRELELPLPPVTARTARRQRRSDRLESTRLTMKSFVFLTL